MAKTKVINLFDNQTQSEVNDVKYSKLLEDFIEPYAINFSDDMSIEEVFELAINGWNFGNLKKITDEKNFETIVYSKLKKEDAEILRKLVDRKTKKFNQYEHYIIDYELTDQNNGEVVLSVMAGDADSYRESIEINSEFTNHEEEFEDNYIDRQAIILKPRKPFLDWINKFDPEDLITDLKDASTYLIDNELFDLEKWLKKNYKTLFEMELDSWWTDQKDWPKKRTYKLFTEWFEITTSSVIYDLEHRPVSKSI
jgi:hypothetical protein